MGFVSPFLQKIGTTPTLLTATRMVLACLLAFSIYSSLQLQEGYWSVVTIAAITQAEISKTFTKSLMRLIGTLLGATLGYCLALLAHGNIDIVLVLFFIVLIASSYIAIQPTLFSYAGTVTGLTMVIVLASSLLSKQELMLLALDRSIEVLLGLFALLLVDIICILFLRKLINPLVSAAQDIKSLPTQLKKIAPQVRYLKAAIKISLACLVTFTIWVYFRPPEGFWATVSCLLIMEESTSNTQIKSFLRFWAHVMAAVFGAACALLLDQHLIYRIVPLALGFAACGYIIGSQGKYVSLGNTTGIALAIMLLVGSTTTSTFQIIAARFFSVIVGIAIAVVISRYLWPHEKRA